MNSMHGGWIRYLRKMSDDQRLNVWHIALLMAIMKLGIDQSQDKIIVVSRSRLMKISHIKSAPTYHKYLKDLKNLGYAKYTPSYHPKVKSFIELFY